MRRQLNPEAEAWGQDVDDRLRKLSERVEYLHRGLNNTNKSVGSLFTYSGRRTVHTGEYPRDVCDGDLWIKKLEEDIDNYLMFYNSELDSWETLISGPAFKNHVAEKAGQISDNLNALEDRATRIFGAKNRTFTGVVPVEQYVFPATYEFAEGDTYWQKDNTTGVLLAEWRYVSGAWTPHTLGSEMIAYLQAGKLRADTADFDDAFVNSLFANMFVANKITAGEIRIGQGENLVRDPLFRTSDRWFLLPFASHDYTGGRNDKSAALVFSNDGSAQYIFQSPADSLMVSNGGKYRITCFVNPSVSVAPGGVVAGLRARTSDLQQTILLSASNPGTLSANVWTRIEGTVNIPSGGYVTATPYVGTESTFSTGSCKFSEFWVVDASEASATVDGLFEAISINAATIYSAEINGAKVKAGELFAPVINGGNINSISMFSSSITGGTISGSVLEGGTITGNGWGTKKIFLNDYFRIADSIIDTPNIAINYNGNIQARRMEVCGDHLGSSPSRWLVLTVNTSNHPVIAPARYGTWGGSGASTQTASISFPTDNSVQINGTLNATVSYAVSAGTATTASTANYASSAPCPYADYYSNADAFADDFHAWNNYYRRQNGSWEVIGSSFSRREFKTNIESVPLDLANKLLDLTLYRFDYNYELEKWRTSYLSRTEPSPMPPPPNKHVGFMLDEVQGVTGLEHAFSYNLSDKTTEPIGLFYQELLLLLQPAVKDLRDRVVAIEQHLGMV